MILLGIVNILYIIFKPEFDPFLILFFYSIPSNTAISVFSHEPIVIYYGKYHNLLLITIISSASTLIAGFFDHTVFTSLLNHPKFIGYKHNILYQKVIFYFDKFPFWTIVSAAFSPIPYWPVKMLSFSRKYPLNKYLLAVLVGRFPRYYLLAAFGYVTLIPNKIIWIIFAVILLGVLFYWIRIKKNYREGNSSNEIKN